MPDMDLFRTGYETIVVDVENRSGTKSGDGPILTALYLEYNRPLSRIGAFRFAMPANDRRLNNITLKKSVLRFWVDGVQAFIGIPDQRREGIDSAGVAQIEFTGRSLVAELAEQASTNVEWSNIVTAPAELIVLASPTWTTDITNGYNSTAVNVYLRTTTESILHSLVQVGEKINEDFIYEPTLSDTDRKLIWLRAVRASSGIRAIQSLGNLEDADRNPNVCFIQSLSIVADGVEIANRVYLYGAGQGDARLNLQPCTNRTQPIELIEGDGGAPGQVTVDCLFAHQLTADDWVQINGASTYDGIYQVSVTWVFTTDFGVDANRLTVTNHTLVDGDIITLSTTGALPAGLVLATTYYVVNSVAGVSIEVSLTAGGAPITLTSDGSGTHTVVDSDSFTYIDNQSGAVTTGQVEKIVDDRFHVRTLPDPDNPAATEDTNYVEDWLHHPSGAAGVTAGVTGLTNDAWPTLEKTLQFTDITPLSNSTNDVVDASSALLTAGISWLKRYSTAQTFYEVTVTKLGTLYPGQTIDVIYEDDNHSINATLYVLDILTSISQDGTQIHTLTVGTIDRWPSNDASAVVGEMTRNIVYRAHQQLNANSYTSVYRLFVGEDQSDDIAEVRFWFGDEVTQLQQILFRFRVLQIVNTTLDLEATTTSSGGSSAPTTDSGGSSAPTSSGGAAHSHTIPGHVHALTVPHAASVDGDVGVVTASTGFWYTGADAGDWTIQTDAGSGGVTSANESAHTHIVTIAGHTHTVTIVAHTHTLTPASRTALIRVASADTWSINDLEYRVNSGTWANLSTATADGIFYYLDITTNVITSYTRRPVQADNTIEIRNRQDTQSLASISRVIGPVVVTASVQTKTVSDLDGNGTTATAITSTAHGYQPGWSVTIAGTASFNGTYAIVTVPNSTTFTFASAVSASNETGTAVAHGLVTGNYVVIEGTTDFNGTWGTITKTDNQTFTYTDTGSGATTENNVGTVRPAKTCMIDGFLSVRDIIQSIAYS